MVARMEEQMMPVPMDRMTDNVKHNAEEKVAEAAEEVAWRAAGKAVSKTADIVAREAAGAMARCQEGERGQVSRTPAA